ncbi:MAG: hypothetical protein WBO55_05955 [Rhizobiaceae bacterium]
MPTRPISTRSQVRSAIDSYEAVQDALLEYKVSADLGDSDDGSTLELLIRQREAAFDTLLASHPVDEREHLLKMKTVFACEEFLSKPLTKEQLSLLDEDGSK